MSHNAKSPNPSIQCGVCSCEYHDQSNYCTLTSIHVDPCPNGNTGLAKDESLCGSYKNRC